MENQTFAYKPATVTAVQFTEENKEELIALYKKAGAKFHHEPVVGSWLVTKTNGRYELWSERAFESGFNPVTGEVDSSIVEGVELDSVKTFADAFESMTSAAVFRWRKYHDPILDSFAYAARLEIEHAEFIDEQLVGYGAQIGNMLILRPSYPFIMTSDEELFGRRYVAV